MALPSSDTLTVQVAFFEESSLDIAVIVTVPTARPVTFPPASTVAIDSSLELQVTPVSMVTPSTGVTVATNVVLFPFFIVVEDGLIETLFTLEMTVTVPLPLTPLPSLAVAVIFTIPIAMPVTSPVAGSTVAIAASSELQVTLLSLALSGKTVAYRDGAGRDRYGCCQHPRHLHLAGCRLASVLCGDRDGGLADGNSTNLA